MSRYYGGINKQKPEFEPRHRFSFSTAEIDDYDISPQSAFTYIGSSLYYRDQARGKLSIHLGPRKGPLIYVSFGSTGTPKEAGLLRLIIDTLVPAGYQLVLQIQNDALRKALQTGLSLKSSDRVCFLGSLDGPPYELYQQADLVISHGGYNTVVESLLHGVPVLLFPNITADRMEVARRVVVNKLGACLNYYRPSAVNLLSKVETLTSSSSTEGLKTQQAQLALEQKEKALHNIISDIEEILL